MFNNAILLLTAMALGPGHSTADAPLTASGEWIVEDNLASCHATRAFGPSEDAVLRLALVPMSGTYTLSVGLKRNIDVSYGDAVRLTFEPSARELQAPVFGFDPFGGKPKVISIEVDAASFDDTAISAINLSKKKQIFINLAIDRLPDVISSLKNCTKKLLLKYGISQELQDSIAILPKPSPKNKVQIGEDIYPAEAFRVGAQGSVAGRFRVAADGSISDCVVVFSSGNASLDRATCASVLKRPKFIPAIGKDGRPTESAQIFSVRWQFRGQPISR